MARGHDEEQHSVAVFRGRHAEAQECSLRGFAHIAPTQWRDRNADLARRPQLRSLYGLLNAIFVDCYHDPLAPPPPERPPPPPNPPPPPQPSSRPRPPPPDMILINSQIASEGFVI